MSSQGHYIEAFNRCVAVIFDTLYNSFPLEINISSSSMPAKIFDDIDDDDFDSAFILTVIYPKAAQWLVRAGYIWCENYSDTMINRAVLSPKGLEVLKQKNKKFFKKETIGASIGKLLRDGSYNLLSKVVEKALSIGFTHFIP